MTSRLRHSDIAKKALPCIGLEGDLALFGNKSCKQIDIDIPGNL